MNTTITPLCLSLSLFLPFGAPVAQDPAPQATTTRVPAVVAAELGATPAVHRAGDLWFAGQPARETIATLEAHGIRRVISLRAPGELDWDEGAAVAAAGLAFESVPIQSPEGIDASTFDRLRELLRQDAGPTVLHCRSANRVGGGWIPFRVLDQGVALETALAEAATIGLRTEAFREAAIAYVTERAVADSVKPGINDPFKDKELDVQSYVERFEVESREVYSARHALLAACRIAPGSRVADVGAGTGLYTLPFLDAVGPAGWVFAVDIAPRFLEHILQRAAERPEANLTGVLCGERGIALPPASVDVVFVCDTYHHFEYPTPVLASIRSALAPGGRLLVVDFERIEGVSREWILGHVRAGKDVVRGEIEAAGFAFVSELEVAGLSENYVLEFRRPE